MKEEFKRAQAWVEQHLHFDKAAGISNPNPSPSPNPNPTPNPNQAAGISMFETVIRILGGLLSAFELSREQALLKKPTLTLPLTLTLTLPLTLTLALALALTLTLAPNPGP